MTGRSNRGSWAGLVLILLAALAVVLVPVFLIQPFAPQSPGAIGLSFALRRWSPLVTLVGLGAALWLAVRLWQGSRWPGRVVLVPPLLLIGAMVWFARQNHFEWMFAPLPDARFARAVAAHEVGSGDMVLAVRQGTDAVAYPVAQLAYHHLVEDEVGGVPIVATY